MKDRMDSEGAAQSGAMRGIKSDTGASPARPASAGIMASYGLGKYLAEFLTGGFAALVFKFYETEVGLGAGLVAVAVLLYSAWNAVNDPLIGFLTSKPTRLSARLGRRFPWILGGSLACALSFVLIFAPPVGLSKAGLFAWFLAAICLYDALYSTWEVNYQSVFPDRFRGPAEREKAAGIGTAIGVLGIAAGSVLPTFVIRYGDRGSYLANAFVFAAVALAAALLLLPGVRESPAMVARYVEQEKIRASSPSFFAQLRDAFRHRDFVAFILLYFFYQSGALTMQASIHYVGDYVLGGRSTTLIFAGMLAGTLAAVPIWLALGRIVRSRQTLLAAAAAAMSLLCLPLFFVRGYWGFVAAMFGWGLSFGGFWLMMTPALADVIDGIVAKTGRRDDGVILGFRAFFGRLAYAVQAVSFWIVHSLSGFSADPRSPSSLLGIRLHLALLPGAFLAMGVVVFLALNTMNAEKAESCRRDLEARLL